MHLRRQTAQVRVLHKAARLGAQVVLGEVRQRAALEPKRDALALHILLAHARNHLRGTAERSFIIDVGTSAAVCKL